MNFASIHWRVAAAALTVSAVVGCARDERHANNGNSQNAEALAALQGNPDSLKPKDEFEVKAKDPTIDANTFFAAGQLAESRAMYPEAVAKYRAALKQNPKHTKAMYRLGVTYAVLKQFNDAINTWQNYLKLTNNSAEAYANLGFCYELAGRPMEAEDAYQHGIAKDGKNVPCRINYGLMLARQEKLPQASVQLQTVLTRAEVHYNLGSILQMQGKAQQAKAEYQEALKSDPNFKDAKTRLAEMGEPAPATKKTEMSKTE